jgi:adenine phosphoribosyltransferase
VLCLQTDPRVVAIAKNCRYYSPKFSPKDVPAFYDLSGITENAEIFQTTMDVFIDRYRAKIATGKGPTVIVGYDARGFVVGPPIALALGIPFVLLRKAGKNPGPLVESSAYSKEYAEHQPDRMCVRLGAIVPGDRVVLIDDLIATGGTALSGARPRFCPDLPPAGWIPMQRYRQHPFACQTVCRPRRFKLVLPAPRD